MRDWCPPHSGRRAGRRPQAQLVRGLASHHREGLEASTSPGSTGEPLTDSAEVGEVVRCGFWKGQTGGRRLGGSRGLERGWAGLAEVE